MKLDTTITRHPLFLMLVGGFITVGIGAWLTDFYAKQNLISQIRLEVYKDEIRQRDEFVDNLSKDVYSRLYNLKVYFWNLRDNSRRETILDSWDKYKNETIEWNTSLKYNAINIDRYFPSDKVQIDTFVGGNDSLKNLANTSFRKGFEEVIQKQFVKIHSKLIDTKIKIQQSQEFPKDQLPLIESEIEYLNSLVYEFTEALSKANNYYIVAPWDNLSEICLGKENKKSK